METASKTNTVQQQKSVEQPARNGKTLPAVPAFPLQAKEQQAGPPLQMINTSRPDTGRHKPIQKKENNTGLPDNLKTGVENLSGHDMSDVKVHYNSAQPAQLNALAYAQGTDIHIAPGQERHLAHEAWHVVQQKQGRVNATAQMKGEVNINDDSGLENEADVMGAMALTHADNEVMSLKKSQGAGNLIQRKTWAQVGLDRPVASARERMANLDADPILGALTPQQKILLRHRVETTLYSLELALENNWLGVTADLKKKIGALLSNTPNREPVAGEGRADVLAKQISESLSELEHAADVVLRSTDSDGEIAMSEVFIGVRGPEGAPPDVAHKDIIGEDNVLPGIDEHQLEADVYYLDGNNVIHVVEVKDSVNALRTKLTEVNQYTRQISWLKKRTADNGRVVEYFIQSPVPFHRLLDEVVLGPFKEIEAAQEPKGQDWFKFGDEKFTYPRFIVFYKAAMSVFLPLLKKYQLDPSDMVGVFLDAFFGTKELARTSISNPAALEGIKAAQNNQLVTAIRRFNTDRILLMLNGGEELTSLEKAIIKPIKDKVSHTLIAAALSQGMNQEILTKALSEWYAYEELR